MNTTIRKVTRKVPFLLLKGYQPRKIVDTIHDTESIEYDLSVERRVALENILDAQYKSYKVRTENSDPVDIKAGDFVFIKTVGQKFEESKKTIALHKFPFLVIERKNGAITLYDGKKKVNFSANVSSVKKYTGKITPSMQAIFRKMMPTLSNGGLSFEAQNELSDEIQSKEEPTPQ